MIVRFGWLLAGALLALAAVAAAEIRFLAGTSRRPPDPNAEATAALCIALVRARCAGWSL